MRHHTDPYAPPAPAPIEEIYKDEHFLVVNKPPGLLSVPGVGPAKKDCLISRVNEVYPEALIVHRLDMSTSGMIILARGKPMQAEFSRMFRDREIKKQYMAVVGGIVKPTIGLIELPLLVDWPNRPKQQVTFTRGKASTTGFTVLSRDTEAGSSKLLLDPITGRSHQLRVHMQAIGHAIVGDEFYATESVLAMADRLLLHACWLQFKHPISHELIDLTSKEPF